MLDSDSTARLASALSGSLLTPTSCGYDTARKVFNAMVDKRPALIARCTGPEDVATCVNFARDHSLPLSVRGGGHNFAGKAVCEGGLMLDMSALKRVTVDPGKSLAHAQAGVTLGEFDAATSRYGLATTLGVATTTGISGLTLGGGYGWLAGKYGLACDNLVSVRIVTADGKIRRCSADEEPDLFWGVRGAGANFGIVTDLEYRLHPHSTVLGGPIFHPLERSIGLFYDELARTAPDELTVLGALLTGPDGKPAFATVVCYCGEPSEGEKLLRPLRSFGKPIADLIQMRPYVELHQLFDPINPPGRRYYNKAHNLARIPEGAIDAVIRQFGSAPTPGTAVAFQQFHGAAARVPVSETAFPHRYEHHVTWINPIGDHPSEDARMIAWGRECWESLRPFADRALYVNALEDAQETGERPVAEVYGANYDRLRKLKKRFDPTNLFRENSNIAPG